MIDDIFMTAATKKIKNDCMNNAWKMNEPNFEFYRVTYTKES